MGMGPPFYLLNIYLYSSKKIKKKPTHNKIKRDSQQKKKTKNKNKKQKKGKKKVYDSPKCTTRKPNKPSPEEYSHHKPVHLSPNQKR